MDMPSALTQFLGSLIAIFVVTALVRKLGLGRAPRFSSEADVRRAVDEVVSGFELTEFALDRAGRAALARDARGRILIIRQHGSHCAGRELDGQARSNIAEGTLTVLTGQTQFGSIRLEIPNAAYWATVIDRLGVRADA